MTVDELCRLLEDILTALERIADRLDHQAEQQP